MNIQRKKNYDIVICNYERTVNIDAMKHDLSFLREQEFDRKGYMSQHTFKSYVWGRVYKWDCVKNIRFDENEKIEDVDYNLKIVKDNVKLCCAYMDEKLYAYYIREGSLVNFIDSAVLAKSAKKHLEYARSEADVQMRNIFLIESIKKNLSSRYGYHVMKNKEEELHCKLMIKEALLLLKENKTKYYILWKCPFIYRLFRIINDPTMLAWEKKVG